MKKIRTFFYRALENKAESLTEHILGNTLSVLILLNIAAMILSTVPSLSLYNPYFSAFEIFSVLIFTLEYALRLWIAPLKKDFVSFRTEVFSPLMVFDLLVILPGLISLIFPGILDTRILRIIRVFRIFRLKQYSDSLSHIFSIIHEHRKDLISAFSLIFMGVITASTLMYYAEKDLQPEKLSSIPDALYWGFITLSTIGYGDVTPVSMLGKIITVLTALMGVAIYALPTSILGAAFYAELRSKEADTISKLNRKIHRLQKKNEELEVSLSEYKLLQDDEDRSDLKTKNRWWHW